MNSIQSKYEQQKNNSANMKKKNKNKNQCEYKVTHLVKQLDKQIN